MMTTVSGRLVHANGTPAEGAAVVFWPSFTVAGNAVAGGHKSFDIIDGDLSVTLYPNGPAQPSGTYYTVKFELDSGPAYEEFWIVPDSPAVTIEQVRVNFPAAPGIVVSPMQLTGAGAETGMILSWDGANWRGGWVNITNVDPDYIRFEVHTAASDFGIESELVELGRTQRFYFPDAGPAARGVVTTGAQIFAGHKTFSDVTVNGTLAGPTLDGLDFRIDALEAGVEGYVPASRRIDTGAGLAGGGDLSVNRILTANVVTVCGRTGNVIVTSADLGIWVADMNAGGYALVNAGQIESAAGGFKFPDGSVQITAATGGGAGAQTPWTQHVDAAGFRLDNAGQIEAKTGGFKFPDGTVQVTAATGGAAGAQTPWIQPVDAAGFALGNAGQIESVSGGFKFPDGSVQTAAALTRAQYQTPWTQPVDAGGFALSNAGQITANILDSAGIAVNVSSAGGAFYVREVNRAGAQANNMAVSPRIVFLWNGVATSQLGIDTLGQVRTFNSAGTGYATFAAGQIICKQSGYVYVDGTLQASAAVAVRKGGTVVATRPGINFIEGANITITAADDSANNRVNVTLAAPAAGFQTPWTTNINAAGFALSNAGDIATNGSLRAAANVYVANDGGTFTWFRVDCTADSFHVVAETDPHTIPFVVHQNGTGTFAGPVRCGNMESRTAVASGNIYWDGANFRHSANGTGWVIGGGATDPTVYSAAAGAAGNVAALGIGLVVPNSGGSVRVLVSGATDDGASRLQVAGVIRTTGGIRFNDNSVQTTAVSVPLPWTSISGIPSMPTAGQDKLGPFIVAGTGAGYFAAGVAIREVSFVGASLDQNYAPRLSFYWYGRQAVQIGMDVVDALNTTPRVRTYDNPGTGYAPFACGRLEATEPILQNLYWNGSGYVYHSAGCGMAITGGASTAQIFTTAVGAAGAAAAIQLRMEWDAAGVLHVSSALRLKPVGAEGGEIIWDDHDGNPGWQMDVDTIHLRIHRGGSVPLRFSGLAPANLRERIILGESVMATEYPDDTTAKGTGGLTRGMVYVHSGTKMLTVVH